MSGKVTVNQTTFEPGSTKVAVPIMGQTPQEVLSQAKNAIRQHPDVIEWRIDYFNDAFDQEIYQSTANSLREILGGTVLLTTFRTTGEGGKGQVPDAEYVKLYHWILLNHLTDMIDIELHFTEETIAELTYLAHAHQIKVILSVHEFVGTPPELEIINVLEQMENQGADIAKIATMPKKFKDVLTLMRATSTESAKLTIPIVAISMGPLGKLSRIAGPLFGSVMSFATVGEASAPSQLAIEDLRLQMTLINK